MDHKATSDEPFQRRTTRDVIAHINRACVGKRTRAGERENIGKPRGKSMVEEHVSAAFARVRGVVVSWGKMRKIARWWDVWCGVWDPDGSDVVRVPTRGARGS